MNRQVVSRFLIAMSLTLVIVAGVVGTKANAGIPANPDVWCSFYSVPTEPGVVYCGGVCPFQGESCQSIITAVGGSRITCTCATTPDD
jgi:hypothetical protein